MPAFARTLLFRAVAVGFGLPFLATAFLAAAFLATGAFLIAVEAFFEPGDFAALAAARGAVAARRGAAFLAELRGFVFAAESVALDPDAAPTGGAVFSGAFAAVFFVARFLPAGLVAGRGAASTRVAAETDSAPDT